MVFGWGEPEESESYAERLSKTWKSRDSKKFKPPTFHKATLLERAQVKMGLREPTVAMEMEDTLDECFPSLTLKQRAIGFGVCFVVGLVLTLLTIFTFPFFQLLAGKPRMFAILFSFGNLVSLASSMFLVGPCRQLRLMFHKGRIVACVVYLGALFATLYVALAVKPPRQLLLLLLVIIQFGALLWYVLSYIPYARLIVKKWISCCLDDL
eukprot:c7861_g1_i4.p1 GENE.c7861_g1_i4~~c7861_g1_i4.p1  ORF type:complete len:210 (+),score=37.94 c7861_g1_i4:31-660(+)